MASRPRRHASYLPRRFIATSRNENVLLATLFLLSATARRAA
jgi:hypothetical protein